MIDFRLKKYWLNELKQSASFLEKLYRPNEWSEELEFQVEKSIFVGFYAIRKLQESLLLANSVVSLNWKLTVYPKVSTPDATHWIKEYNLFESSKKQLILKEICHQFVHSAHFSPFVPDGTFCVGFYFTSDRESKKELYYIQLVNVINIFLSVANQKRTKLTVKELNNVLFVK